MRIYLSERIVERCMNPANPNYLKATHMSTKTIDTYTSEIIPRVGEVICTEKGSYDVVGVEYLRHCAGFKGDGIMSVTVEVTPHKIKKSFSVSGYTVEENWPLISELEVDIAKSCYSSLDETFATNDEDL